MDSLYRIGELAGLAEVSAKTIRFYEKVGVLPPPKRLTNGYRVYDDHDLARLRFCARGQSAGSSLGSDQRSDEISRPQRSAVSLCHRIIKSKDP